MTAAPEPFASGWNFADIWEAHARRFPHAIAQIHGELRYTWAQFNDRATGVAAAFIGAGLDHQHKVAQYLYNGPEYMESMFAAFKVGLVPVNTNYRYTDTELVYLWDNADAAAVVFHGSFTPHIEHIRAQLPKVKLWLWVADGDTTCPEWAQSYEAAAVTPPAAPPQSSPRSGDDLFLLYTGGTTGLPKGVMWRQHDVAMVLDAQSKRPLPSKASLAALTERVTKPGIVAIPAAPLMHGTGSFNALNVLMLAGCVVTLQGRSFDVTSLLDCIQHDRATSMSIVGDAFAKPIVRALDGEPRRWDFSSMRVILSSGVMWSAETKQGLLRHNPRLIMVDTLGSSEAIGMASSITGGGDGQGTANRTAAFTLNAHTRVIADDGTDVVAGSGQRGLVALKGHTPIGYYKDPHKSAQTFRLIDGERYSIPGDYAEVDNDGTLRLLGRGSQCINTGGEKVYPEEVEEALKRHPAIHDAAVVGVPDDRFGEAVVALVQRDHHVTELPSDREVIDHVRQHLAAYKSPKHLVWLDSINRAANGKVDYATLRQLAIDA